VINNFKKSASLQELADERVELGIMDQTAVPGFDHLKKYYSVPGFKIGGVYNYNDPGSFEYGGEKGICLEHISSGPVQIGYMELGTKHYDAKGNIDNAVLICPYYSGDSSNMLDFWHVSGSRTDFCGGPSIGPGLLFDTDKYYFILADSLGLWGCSKPSSSHPGQDFTAALGLDFPNYSVEDCVQLMYRLLKDHLHIQKLKMVTGVSFGATLSYCWAALHPDFVQKCMPLGGTIYQNKGMLVWLFDLVTSAVQSDPVYTRTKGNYYHLPLLERPIMGNMFAWSILKQSAYVDEFRVTQSYNDYMLEAFDWVKSKEAVKTLGKKECFSQKLFDIALAVDSNDLIFRNKCQAVFNIEDKLDRIKSDTLIFHVNTDQWIRPHIAKQACRGIKDAQLVLFDNDFGHYAVFMIPGKYKDKIVEFMKSGNS
jgi:homoserine acetyltransferase